MAKKGIKSERIKDRQPVVLRLYEREREAIRQLGQGEEKADGIDSRHAAFEQLIPIVKKLEKSLGPKPKPRPLRVEMPTKLRKSLARISKKTGYSQIELLLMAIGKFREKYAPPENK